MRCTGYAGTAETDNFNGDKYLHPSHVEAGRRDLPARDVHASDVEKNAKGELKWHDGR
jgi:hypothetical protein